MKTNLISYFLSGSLSGIRQVLKMFAVLAIAWFGVCVGVNRLYASCITLDDLPLDVEQQQAPGIVMFTIDNSGSMDWEILVQANTYNGMFMVGTQRYGYVFKNPGDNAYSSTDSSFGYTIEEHAPTYWQSQWSGYNRMYYDPTATYIPWPTKTNADPDNPRSNPIDSTPTLSMSGIFYDFGVPLISLESLKNAGAVFVDNEDPATGTDLYPDIIMDTESSINDPAWGGQNYGSFSGSGGQAWTATTDNSAYPGTAVTNGKRYWYTATKNKTYKATWSFTNIPAGNYDVYAWWPSSTTIPSKFSSAVKYTLPDGTVVTKDQTTNGGSWQLLATGKNFNGGGTVVINHTTPNTTGTGYACADAIKIHPTFFAPPPLQFVKTGPNWTSNYSAVAYKRPQDASPTYLYTNANGTYSATWTANNLVAEQLYDVYAVWAEGGVNRSTAVHYYTTHSSGTTDTTVNQEQTLGYWTKIAGGTNGITFTGGIGKVVLGPHTVTNYNGSGTTGDRACADAVAFVPHGTLNVQINRSHYYTKDAAGNKYLVNINGGSIQYYKYTDDGDNITESNEILRLTVTEAAAAGIVTGRTYTQERQNFANWFSYYRRRILTAKNAVSNVMNTMQGVYIGFITLNSDSTYRQYAKPVRVTIDKVLYDESAALISKLFDMDVNNGTPLRVALDNTGKYFKGLYGKPSPLPSTNFSDNTYPFFIADKGGSCQQAFAIAMTDGYWNEDYNGTAVGNADGADDGPTDNGLNGHQIDGFDGGKFADSVTSVVTLADVAMYYYEHDLNTNLANNVPINTNDQAAHQHMVTYTLSFGANGTIDQSLYSTCPAGNCPTWPAPPKKDEATAIDDLWHAAVNGRGKYINAASPMELVDAMNALKMDIENRLGSAASLATSTIERQVGTMIYQGTYNTSGWFGEVNALEINVETGAVGSDPIWRASEHVPEWTSRNILSYNGSTGITFEFANISDAQETLLSNNGDDPAQLVDFIRGDTSNNVSHGGTFRVRTKPIGDFVHSTPTYFNGVIYIGSNDGMLHAIDAENGHELFCYVPGLVYDHLSELAIPAYSHKYYVDGTPAVSKVGDRDILVCGLGKGGKGCFALDVTHPDAMTADNVLWEYPPTTDNDMGYTFSQTTIVTTDAGQAVVFGNGYDSVNQKAVLYILNPITGAVVRKIDTLTAGCNGLSTPKLVDVSGEGHADYAFAGDLNGNMWKFDIRGTVTNNWKVYYQAGTQPKPLISVKNAQGYAQSITAAPDVMLDCATSEFANSGTGLMVIFGTGRYLNSSDFDDKKTQSLYGIWDWGGIWEARLGYDVAKTKYLGTLGTDRSVSNVSGKSLLQQTVVVDTGQYLILSGNTVAWYDPTATSGTPGIHMGWFFDLSIPSERCIREPMLRAGVAIMISTIPSASPCEAGGSSVLYQLEACTGGQTSTIRYDDNGNVVVDAHGNPVINANPQFDINGDGVINDQDLINGLPPTGKKFDQILFEPIEISGILYLSTALGQIDSEVVPPNLVGMQYWRVIQ